MKKLSIHSRESLLSLIKWLYGLLIIGFVLVLLRSLGGPGLTVSGQNVFNDVEIGETTLRRWQGQRVWVTRWSQQQLKDLEVLQGDTTGATNCDLQLPLCVLSSKTAVAGIEIRFTARKPNNLSREQLWYGGFVDPSNGLVYDRSGRAYTSQARLDALPAFETQN